MFLDRLLNQGNAPLLLRTVQFTEQRHALMMENVANVDTPGYQQKDLSVEKFQQALAARVQLKNRSGPGAVGFDDVSADPFEPEAFLYHDGNNRSMEQMMTESAKNALLHNAAVELLRRQYSTIELALRERIA